MPKITYDLPIDTFHIDFARHVSNIVYVQWMEIGRLLLLQAPDGGVNVLERLLLHRKRNTMTKDREVVVGRWRIVETQVWDLDALDLVVPAHIAFDRNGLGEMQLIAIGASIDYRVEQGLDGPVVEFSWSGFDDGDPTSGRASARVDGDTMRGKLFIHQGDDSTFVARRESGGKERLGSHKSPKPPAMARIERVPAKRGVRRRPRRPPC